MKKIKILSLIIILLLPFLLYIYYQKSSNGYLKIHFLSVGQGDSALITSPSNKNILVDGGPNNDLIRELGKFLPFFERRIDLIILSHPDSDHLFGLIEVLKRYEIGKILLTGINVNTPEYMEFLRIIEEKNIHIIIAEDDEDFLIDNIFIDIHLPRENIAQKSFANTNDTSIVFSMHYGENIILFPGDIEEKMEQELLLENPDLETDIIKISHHGSNTSTQEEFLEKIKPDFAIISCGLYNQFSHPHPDLIKRLILQNIRVYRTDYQGNITFILDKEKIIKIDTEFSY
ncbi:MAG: putative hydrolase [Candidatus Peregrinibacteria bacterium GW2011_GWA2_33_10]|nr:MAG: putative hydrolase [Candidatus Peregrinibacteria bacterium GW2011_GWA2_33_10]KKP41025.1 MAG: metallo-beta-lactamase family protein, competence protein ComEC [Candidatus Peregrinibacteria bacterium GW2011_GWC2_33_13]OGJ49865.1 MAG: hypothetical protein A2229_00090 [Candidatus Peregrinibacteria bacterium RIFOXYA2_FULL_33_7]